MHVMKRFPLAFFGAVALLAIATSAATATEVQIGKTVTPMAAPVCPAGVPQNQCNIVVPQLTVFNTASDGVANPMAVTKTGELVSVTIGVSSISSNAKTLKTDESYLDSTYGGPAEAELAVLRQVGKPSKLRWSIAAETPAYQLQPYIGQVVQFPLATPLPVVPGEVVALTVPTWAPILTYDLTPGKFSYRQSRTLNCTKSGGATAIQAQLTIGEAARYGCSYSGTRVQYSAEEIMTPIPSSVLK
jgi:hypothetical protein